MKVWHKLTGLAVLTIAATGCLLKDTTHTWYLHPGGSVTWTVVEANVRSDARAAADRTNEELAYWESVRSGTHDMAEAFRALGATTPRTRIVRAEVPFTVITDATFPALDDLGRQLIRQTGLAGASELLRDGDAWQWTMTIRDPHAPDSEPDPDNGILALAESLETLTIVLVTGRFESAEGFTLSSDSRVAMFDEKTTKAGVESSLLVLRLRWVNPVKGR